MEQKKFYDKDRNPIRYPRKEHMRLSEDGEIEPARDHNGRKIIGYGMGNKPIVKVDFRKSMDVLDEISHMLDSINNVSHELIEFKNNKSEVLQKELREMNPEVAKYISQVSEKKSNICLLIGKWVGLRYAANERDVDQYSNLEMTKAAIRSVENWDEEWKEVIGEIMPESVKVILQSIFI